MIAEYSAIGGHFETQPLLASDGNFYTTTVEGSICQITLSGTVTKIYQLPSQSEDPSPLIQAADSDGALNRISGSLVNSPMPLGKLHRGLRGSAGSPDRNQLYQELGEQRQ